jgi:hypothetical protein
MNDKKKPSFRFILEDVQPEAPRQEDSKAPLTPKSAAAKPKPLPQRQPLKKAPLPLDDERPGSLFDSELERPSLERTLPFPKWVVIIALMGLIALMVLGYFDIKKRVTITQDTGTSELIKLSKNLESSFSSLSIKQAKLEEVIKGQTKTLQALTAETDKSLKNLDSRFKEVGKSVKKLQSGESERHQIAQQVAAMRKTVAPLQQQLTDTTAQIQQINDGVSGRMDALTVAVDKSGRELIEISDELDTAKQSLAEVNNMIRSISATYIDQAALDAALSKDHDKYARELEQLAILLNEQEVNIGQLQQLSKTVALLDKRVRSIEAFLTQMGPSLPKGTILPPAAQGTADTAPEAPAERPSKSKKTEDTGAITEQDIQN